MIGLSRLSAALLLLPLAAHAEKLVKSSALISCMTGSEFAASNFDVVFFPENNTVTFDITAISTINNNVTANIDLIAYGFSAVNKNVDACSIEVKGSNPLCPLQDGHFNIQSSVQVPSDITSQIPGIAYAIPDLDGVVRVTVYANSDLKTPIACVEATLTNGKTVQTKYASWGLAAVCLIGLITAGIVSLIGHQSTASHIASNTVSLFVYFQSVAIIAMMAVNRLPPIAAAWAQNFMWTMGLMRVGFLQKIYNWYVQSTGGTATNILPNKNVISIEVQKRDVSGLVSELGNYASEHTRHHVARNIHRAMRAASGVFPELVSRAASTSNNDTLSNAVTSDEKDPNLAAKTLVLRGIERVAFLANIELSSIFLTGLIFFVALGLFFFLALAMTKGILELLVRMNAMHPDRCTEFRRGWSSVTKGLLFRLLLVGFSQLSVLCLWELVERDSAATFLLSLLSYILVLLVLGFASYKVITIARKSLALHKNPAYILFSDQEVLNRLGFLYVQFRATAYYFIVPMLLYTFWKSCFIAFGQASGKAQAVGVFLGELAYLVALCWLKPYMDKTTNGFNIAISVINFINSIFFLFFSNLFGQPAIVSSIMGVVFFVLNAVFSLVLLIMIIISCIWALVAKDPDTRYQPMRDDRASFMRDANLAEKKQGTTELDALGMSARDGAEATPTNPFTEAESDYSGSQVSLQHPGTGAFPQARLPRNHDQHLSPYSNGYENHSSSSLDLASGTAYPSTTYRGYYPADEDADMGYSHREPPRF